MKDCFKFLKNRGFFQQTTNEEALSKKLNNENVTFYIGYDPTNTSLHLGHLVPIMASSFLQKMGHRPIALMGGGTAMIGDPSGRTSSRPILTIDEIDSNSLLIKKQLEHFVVLDGDKGLFINNASWLRNINYVDFLRDIGKHFSVNRMLSFETYKEKYKNHGLSFLEFNYILLQSYDFLMLYKNYNCTLQIGGDDQWANMISGVELIRRVTGDLDAAECLTLPLILTSDGKKMGKTQNGAIFLSKDVTNVYDFYQYWINVTDNDVIRFLKLYTFIDDNEIERLSTLKGEELIEAKKILAFEVTKIVHSEKDAIESRESSLAAFGSTSNIELIPKFSIQKNRIESGISVLDIFVESGLVESKSEVRRLIKQNGIKVNEEKVTDENLTIDSSFILEGGIIIRSGKKKVKRIEIM